MDFCKKEAVFTVAVLLAVFSCFFVPLSREYLSYPDYRVLALLFCLMLIVAGIRELGVFRLMGEKLTARVGDSRGLELVLVLLCFFSGMLITNDVALITFVPFGLELLASTGMEKRSIRVVVLQTIAANLGSMLTPVGNPQNLYLYSLMGLSLGEFVLIMLPLTAASLVLLLGIILTGKKEPAKVDKKSGGTLQDKKRLALLLVLFIICLGSVVRIVPWQASLVIVCIAALLTCRELFAKVDYCLLGTFMGFFIFVGNMQNIPAVRELIESLLSGRELLISVAASQIISNVPAAMLLSGFTGQYKELLYGVNIGGLGTLIASLASLISYKYYCVRPDADKGGYLKQFTLWSILFLALLLTLAAIL